MSEDIREKLLTPNFLETHFSSLNYDILQPSSVINNSDDTIFTTAGIQPVFLNAVNNKPLTECNNMYVAQPVLRTQYIKSLSEGFSLAFVNTTTVRINNTYENHLKLVNDWLDLFKSLNFNPSLFSTKEKDSSRIWRKHIMSGHKVFYLYNGLELGDSTFFTSIINTEDGSKPIETMRDVGFGLERIRWTMRLEASYYDINSFSNMLEPKLKALLSAMALLTVNGVIPSNKDVGYRVRLFAKTIIQDYRLDSLPNYFKTYIDECLSYWADWQQTGKTYEDYNKDIILDELLRNENRYILDLLSNHGHDNVHGININLKRDEFFKRLRSANITREYVEEVLKTSTRTKRSDKNFVERDEH